MKAKWLCSGRPGAAARLGLLLTLAAAAGCSGASPGHVSGQVQFNGKPLPGGLITFLPADPKSNAISTNLDEQGRFSVVLPAGEVRVSIDNRQLEPRQPIHLSPAQLNLPSEARKALGGGGAAAPPPASHGTAAAGSSGRYVKIPDRYYDGMTSGLGFKVQSGEQTHDIPLTN